MGGSPQNRKRQRDRHEPAELFAQQSRALFGPCEVGDAQAPAAADLAPELNKRQRCSGERQTVGQRRAQFGAIGRPVQEPRQKGQQPGPGGRGQQRQNERTPGERHIVGRAAGRPFAQLAQAMPQIPLGGDQDRKQDPCRQAGQRTAGEAAGALPGDGLPLTRLEVPFERLAGGGEIAGRKLRRAPHPEDALFDVAQLPGEGAKQFLVGRD